jgi:hypothetical protein
MGKTRGSIAGLEEHVGLSARLDAPDKFARLFERPGGGNARGLDEVGREGE